MNTITPIFQHDCPQCKFVGRLDGKDAYICTSSVVLRAGHDGPDYISTPLEMAKRFEPFKTILRMGDPRED